MLLSVCGIDVEVIRKRNKNMYLRLKDDGTPVVTAPLRMSQSEIERFVSSHLSWIEQHQHSLLAQPTKGLRECVSGEPLWVWGKCLTLEVLPAPRWMLVTIDDAAFMTAPPSSNAETRRRWLREWYREQLKERGEAELRLWEERTGLHFKEWRTKWMTSRWGTCNTRDRRIWLNVQLAKHPTESLSYVALHEIAHLKVPNHGSEFAAILNEHMPGWKQRRKELNARRFELTE